VEAEEREDPRKSLQDLNEEVRSSVLEILRIIDDLNGEIDRRETRLANLFQQRGSCLSRKKLQFVSLDHLELAVLGGVGLAKMRGPVEHAA
jgi:hypothetical protein